MINFQELYSCKKKIKHASTKIMSHNKVRIDEEQPRYESFDHLPFIIEILNVILPLPEFLIEVKRHFPIDFSKHAEVLELIRVARAFLVDILVDKAGNHGNFIRVLLRSSGFE